jgi:hypothetical protein
LPCNPNPPPSQWKPQSYLDQQIDDGGCGTDTGVGMAGKAQEEVHKDRQDAKYVYLRDPCHRVSYSLLPARFDFRRAFLANLWRISTCSNTGRIPRYNASATLKAAARKRTNQTMSENVIFQTLFKGRYTIALQISVTMFAWKRFDFISFREWSGTSSVQCPG